MEKRPEKTVDRPLEIQSLNVQPTTAEEMVNKYGTYEIQPTSDSGNVFPTIAAGLPRVKPPKQED
jgi:hypothetical protein